MATLQSEPVKIGVIGLGRFGKLHAATLSGLAEAELVGLVARRQASLDAVAEEHPQVRALVAAGGGVLQVEPAARVALRVVLRAGVGRVAVVARDPKVGVAPVPLEELQDDRVLVDLREVAGGRRVSLMPHGRERDVGGCLRVLTSGSAKG